MEDSVLEADSLKAKDSKILRNVGKELPVDNL